MNCKIFDLSSLKHFLWTDISSIYLLAASSNFGSLIFEIPLSSRLNFTSVKLAQRVASVLDANVLLMYGCPNTRTIAFHLPDCFPVTIGGVKGFFPLLILSLLKHNLQKAHSKHTSAQKPKEKSYEYNKKTIW